MAKDFTEPNSVILVQAMQERDATIVSLRAEYATVKGSARRDPQDKHDPEVAYFLAVSRALEKLATKYRKRAQGRMNTLDNNRKQKQAAAVSAAIPVTAMDEAAALAYIEDTFRQSLSGFPRVHAEEAKQPLSERLDQAYENAAGAFSRKPPARADAEAPTAPPAPPLHGIRSAYLLLSNGRTMVVDGTTGATRIDPRP